MLWLTSNSLLYQYCIALILYYLLFSKFVHMHSRNNMIWRYSSGIVSKKDNAYRKVEIHYSCKIPWRKKISLNKVFVSKMTFEWTNSFHVHVSSSWLCWDGESSWLGFGLPRRLFGFGIRGHLASPGLSSLSSAWPSPSTTPPAKYDLKLFLHHENSIGLLLHKRLERRPPSHQKRVKKTAELMKKELFCSHAKNQS